MINRTYNRAIKNTKLKIGQANVDKNIEPLILKI